MPVAPSITPARWLMRSHGHDWRQPPVLAGVLNAEPGSPPRQLLVSALAAVAERSAVNPLLTIERQEGR